MLETRTFVMAILHWKQGLLCDKKIALEWQYLLLYFEYGECPFPVFQGVPRGSVVKCLTRNPGVLGSSLTGSSGFFRGSVLGQDTSEPSLVLVKPRKA